MGEGDSRLRGSVAAVATVTTTAGATAAAGIRGIGVTRDGRRARGVVCGVVVAAGAAGGGWNRGGLGFGGWPIKIAFLVVVMGLQLRGASEAVGLTVNFPIGVYSKRHKSWSDIPNGGTVSIPNDPTNGGRVLLLLRDKGVIKLKEGVGFKPKISDITDNPKKLKFIEIDAAQSPRALDDVDAAAINTNYATQAGLDPVKDPILREDPKGPYVNLIAVRAADKDKPWVKTLVESYQTPEVKELILAKFKGAVLPSW